MRESAEKLMATEAPTQPSAQWREGVISVSASGSAVVPPSLIVGRLPIVKGASAREAAYNVACLVLDSDRIALICSVSGQFVYYLACLAADLASNPRGSTCLLAASLPGMPGHRGQGLYTADNNRLVACVLFDARGLRSYVGEPDVAAEFPVAEGAAGSPVYRVELDEKGPRLPAWESFGEMQRATVRRYSAYAASALTALALLGGAFWGYGLYMNAENDERFTKLTAETERLLSARPAQLDDGTLATSNQAWREFAQLSAFCLRHGGKILLFKASGQRSTWRIELNGAAITDEQIKTGLGGSDHDVVSRGEKWIVQSKEAQ